MQHTGTSWARQQIEADIRHLRQVIYWIEDTHHLTPEDMRLRHRLRRALARKREILDRLNPRNLTKIA